MMLNDSGTIELRQSITQNVLRYAKVFTQFFEPTYASEYVTKDKHGPSITNYRKRRIYGATVFILRHEEILSCKLQNATDYSLSDSAFTLSVSKRFSNESSKDWTPSRSSFCATSVRSTPSPSTAVNTAEASANDASIVRPRFP